ncbi:MAG: asparagine synthase (glutamine-hydrolyzing) [Candidatus Competibacteraceae bacterium]|nr:asparagine synthase (glutamine-hydrolyzing) [Candidatus Competibacteraceae bacterium]
MCGLSGFFSAPPFDPSAEMARLERMRMALAHRGPDGSGIEIFNQAALIHNRLAIIDLAGGHQPLFGASGACIVFNGEIYNYRELRARLPDYPFRTYSDTEVIVALYESEGIAGFRHLRGMYAFALWDGRCGVLVRDPAGIKPLFYSVQEDRLLFASEAKAILAHGNERAHLDPAALHLLLNFRYVAGESSLFTGIVQVPPGAVLVWTSGRLECLALAEPDASAPENIAVALSAAVQSHLVADVPLGCYLSGGIDSALVAHHACRHSAIEGFTLEVGDDPREADHAAETAHWLGMVDHRQAFCIPDSVALHRSLIWHLETPKVNALQGAMLAEFTAQRVKVALSGLGGDELFYGYNAHRIMWLAQQAWRGLPGSSNRWLAAVLRPLTGREAWSEPRRAVEMLAALPAWGRVYGILRNVWDSPALQRLIYGERMLDAALPDAFGWLARRFPDEPDAAAAMARFEFRHKLVNDLLWQEDRVSMRVGLEVRVPFLDRELTRCVQCLPRSALMPGGRKKHLLKDYARTELPDFILRRPKSGFQLNIIAAATGELKPVFDEYLSEERLRHHRLFNPRFVQAVRAQPAHKSLRWHYFLLYLMAQCHLLQEVFDAD